MIILENSPAALSELLTLQEWRIYQTLSVIRGKQTAIASNVINTREARKQDQHSTHLLMKQRSILRNSRAFTASRQPFRVGY